MEESFAVWHTNHYDYDGSDCDCDDDDDDYMTVVIAVVVMVAVIMILTPPYPLVSFYCFVLIFLKSMFCCMLRPIIINTGTVFHDFEFVLLLHEPCNDPFCSVTAHVCNWCENCCLHLAVHSFSR